MAGDLFEQIARNPYLLGPAGVPRFREDFVDQLRQGIQRTRPAVLDQIATSTAMQAYDDGVRDTAEKEEAAATKQRDTEAKVQQKQQREDLKARQQREMMDFEDSMRSNAGAGRPQSPGRTFGQPRTERPHYETTDTQRYDPARQSGRDFLNGL